MNETYKDLVGKDITLFSKKRTYRFRCTHKDRFNGYNLRLFGT